MQPRFEEAQNYQYHAQMAELVDALVSNTNAFGRAGSTPALGTFKKSEECVSESEDNHHSFSLYAHSNSLCYPTIYLEQ